MRRIIFILVLSAILIPVAAVHQGLVSHQKMDTTDLTGYWDAALTKMLAYCEQADHWLRTELR